MRLSLHLSSSLFGYVQWRACQLIPAVQIENIMHYLSRMVHMAMLHEWCMSAALEMAAGKLAVRALSLIKQLCIPEVCAYHRLRPGLCFALMIGVIP
jgi:hypothetical protein